MMYFLCCKNIIYVTVTFVFIIANRVRNKPVGLKEIDGLLVPPGKAYMLLTDHLIIWALAHWGLMK